MKEQTKTHFYLIGLGIALVLAVVIAVSSQVYLDLNDDVLIKDILSGAYTGTPAAHNIQMLYPLSFLLSLLFRVIRIPDWYGIFLYAAQFVCVGLILAESLRIIGGDRQKGKMRYLVTGLVLTVFLLTLVYPHLIILQYTFTCGMLSGTAALLFITGEKRSQFVTATVLLLTALALRSEMMLLTLPLVALTLLYRRFLLHREQKQAQQSDETGAKRKQLLRVIVAIAAGMFVIAGIHRIAYGSEAWRTFTRLFDARTQLYDYYEIPAYPEDADFFRSEKGGALSEAQAVLFQNYNYGLEEAIDADVMEAAARYAAEKDKTLHPAATRLSDALSDYRYRLTHVAIPESFADPQTDAPWNLSVLFLYVFMIVLYMMPQRGDYAEDEAVAIFSASRMLSILPEAAILFCVRSGLWLYLLYRGRAPVRVTHGLYFVEAAILLGMLLRRVFVLLDLDIPEAELAKMPDHKKVGPDGKRRALTIQEADKEKRWDWDNLVKVRSFRTAMLFLIAMVCLSFFSMQVLLTNTECERRAEVNAPYDALYEYCRAHPDNYYLIDVYSSVGYSEKAFKPENTGFANYDIMGGWASKSPVSEEKAANAGLQEMADALLQEHVLYVTAKTGLDAQDPDNILWLQNFYAAKGIGIRMEAAEQIAGTFTIYRVEAQAP